MSAIRCVEIADCIATESLVTNGRVMVSGRGFRQRGKTIGRVVESRCVRKKCSPTSGRVFEAGGVVKERVKTNGRIRGAACKAEEGIRSLSRVKARIAAVRGRDNRSHYGRKPKADEYERDEKKSEPQRRPVD